MDDSGEFRNHDDPMLGFPGRTVGDFWRWAYSDILSNRNRSIFAKFIVGVTRRCGIWSWSRVAGARRGIFDSRKMAGRQPTDTLAVPYGERGCQNRGQGCPCPRAGPGFHNVPWGL
jgi:hypothetical protein